MHDSLVHQQVRDTYERVLLTKAGHQCLVRWQGNFTRDTAGEVSGFWLSGEAVTGHDKAPQALKDDDTHLQDFLDNAQDLVQHLSADNNFLFVNKAWKEKLGYTDEELATRTLADIVGKTHVVHADRG